MTLRCSVKDTSKQYNPDADIMVMNINDRADGILDFADCMIVCNTDVTATVKIAISRYYRLYWVLY